MVDALCDQYFMFISSIKWFLGLTEIYSYIPHLSGVATVNRDVMGVNITDTTMGGNQTR